MWIRVDLPCMYLTESYTAGDVREVPDDVGNALVTAGVASFRHPPRSEDGSVTLDIHDGVIDLTEALRGL